MDFKNISNHDLILRLEKLARTERKITHLILWHIHEVEARKIYFELGFESLYAYLTQGLKYSESAAYRRIQAARLLAVAPVLVTEKLESGALNLSQLAQMQKYLKDKTKSGALVTSQKVSEVLLALEGKNNFESQKVLAQKFDIEIKTIEQTKPQQDDSVRVEVTFSKEQFAALKLAKSLLSHQCPEGQWSQVITLLAEKFSQSRLGKGAVASSNEDAMPANAAGGSQRYRPALPVEIKRQVFARAQHQCEFHNALTGVRCDSKFQLEIDHRKPLALGGGHDLGNLRVLCRSHNQRAWQQSLGRRSGNWVRNHSQDHSVKNATQIETF